MVRIFLFGRFCQFDPLEQLLDAPERGGFAVFVRRVADPDGDERLPLFQVVVREDESRIFRPAAFAAQHMSMPFAVKGREALMIPPS